MARPRILLVLRIAFSVVCAIVWVLLIALWVRSYWACDMVYWPLSSGKAFTISTTTGSRITYSSYTASFPVADIIFEPVTRWRSQGTQCQLSDIQS